MFTGCTSQKHECEEVTMYSFTAYNSAAHSYKRNQCKTCGERLSYDTLIKGTLDDQSYLEAIKEHSDGSEIIPGEYYTITATVPMGFYGYGSNTLFLTCEVGNEEIIVRFNVEFREEFREMVRSVEKGDKITFRGKFYDKGCGFTDCELIDK
jgi:hypothetical protein